jgi:two-component system cell cycle sensor histidine kinase/response regulator CckA
MNPSVERNLRILVIDDNRAVHDDFRKILCPAAPHTALEDAEAILFEAKAESAPRPQFTIDSAYQGQEGLERILQSVQREKPYSMAFVDVRMPPGWDGIETVGRIWKVCPDLQIVICTAYSDYSWDEMAAELRNSDQLVILKKPFDAVEVLQLANALTEKWRLQQEARHKLDELEKQVQERTRVLQQTAERLQLEIVERQRAAEALREKATLLDLAHDGIMVRDLEGAILYWNTGAELLYGWKAEEAVGRKAQELLYRETAADDSATRRVLAEGAWTGELHQITRAGKEVTVSGRSTLMRDAAGKPVSFLIINTDITEKKKLEAQFLRAQRMEGIGTLATGMAHDLNNILAPILISAGTLRWDLSPEEREDAIHHIEASVKRGAEIIRQVLTFGRGVAGERVAVSPLDLLQDLSRIISETFPKDLTTVFDAKDGLWTILGDRTQLHQVLLNLCINARDAMSEGGRLSLVARNIAVDASMAALHSPAGAGPYVLIEVSDTGSGIAPADMERIFDPFFTTKDFGKGTGLGLSTVLGIVKSHHGFVTVESVVKQGTTFKIFLPASSQAAKSDAPVAARVLPRGSGESILIVDDEADIASVNRRILEKQGYRVSVARDGREALEVLARDGKPVDLVITDLMMPEMDGVALIRALKENNPTIRVIASSGLDGGSRAVELQMLGVTTFLPKPYTTEKLLAAMHDVLGAKRATN